MLRACMKVVATDRCPGQGLPDCAGRSHVDADPGNRSRLAAVGRQARQPTARPSHDRVGGAKRSTRPGSGSCAVPPTCRPVDLWAGPPARTSRPGAGRAKPRRAPDRPMEANPSISTRNDEERGQPSVDFIGVSSIMRIFIFWPTPSPRMIFLKNKTSLCPTCRHESPSRIPRSLWMRILGVGMAFKCNWCGKRFVVRPKARLRSPQ